MQPVPVVVDDRESAGPVLALLQKSPDFEVTVKRLRLGDYLVGRRFAIERKTAADLVASIIDGRLFAQARRLAAATPRPALIVEGEDAALANTGLSRESILGALVTVTLFFGLPVLRTRSPEETASVMLFASRQGEAVATGALPRHGYRPGGKRARQLFILQGLPGIGPARARRLLEGFGSVAGVINAPAAALQSITGIGPRRAAAVRWAVEQPTDGYSGGT